MVLRVSICVHALILAACTMDAGRCEDLRAYTRGATNQLSRGCLADDECRPVALACGEVRAVRKDRDVRALSTALSQFEALCGCGEADGGVPDGGPTVGSARALCLSGVCRVAADAVPAECAAPRAAILDAIEAENRCVLDADCTALRVGTCPAICSAPTALGADRSRVDALITAYDSIPGCRACADDCPAPSPLRCVSGRCATVDADGGVCGSAGENVDRILSTPGTCRGLADCRYVGFGKRRGSRCGAAATLGDATRLQSAVTNWAACCTDCETCAAPPESFARCSGGRCLGADECALHLTPADFRITFTEPTAPSGVVRTLAVSSSGEAVVTPPGVTATLGADELASLVALTDAAALLCLDSSFHPPAPETIRLSATGNGATVDIAYADADPRPSGLAALERSLRALVARIVGGP